MSDIARTIGDLMRDSAHSRAQAIREQAGIAARAQQERGQIWGQTVQQIGQIAGNLPRQLAQEKDAAQEREVRQLRIDAEKRAQKVNTDVNAFMQGAMTQTASGAFTFDRAKLRDAFTRGNIPLPVQEQAFSSLDAVDASLGRFAAVRTDHLADLAHAALSIPNGATPEGFAMTAAVAVKNGLVTKEQLEPIVQAIADGADVKTLLAGVRGLSERYKDQNKLVTVAPGASLVNPNTQQAVYTQPAKETAPAPFSLAPGAVRFDAQGKEIASVPANQPTPPAPAPFSLSPGSVRFDAMGKKIASVPPNPTAGGATTAAGGAGTLDPDGLELAAVAYRLAGKLPARDAKQNGAIISTAAKQGKALGHSAAQTIQKQAIYAGDAKALGKMAAAESAAEAFEVKANAQAGLVSELSKKVSRTQFPIINDVLLSGKERVFGDENTHLFTNALLTFTTEYAKIMEGATGSVAGSSESARRDAAKLISTGLNNGTVQKTIAQMQWEMRQTILGYDVAKQHISERMLGTPQSAAPVAAPTLRYNPATGKTEPIK